MQVNLYIVYTVTTHKYIFGIQNKHCSNRVDTEDGTLSSVRHDIYP
jgi:hypothetical protein